MSDAAAEIGRLLSQRIGLDPTTVGPTLIAGAILARMNAAGVTDPASYVRLAENSTREFGELVELVVVSESWFFRDRRPFERLATVATTRWFLDPGTPIVRALSVPCAGGEEPYSIAMRLLDAGLLPERIQIDAADLSLRALDIAARGVYGRNSFREQDVGFRDRYFRPVGSTYALDASVKRLVRFHHVNLFDESFFRDAEPFHAIFCRNLLIYLDAPSRRRAFDVFDRLLASDGVLFIGHAEATPRIDSRFRQIDDPGTFCYERGLASLPPPQPVLRIDGPPPRPRIERRPAPALPTAKAPAVPLAAPSRSLLEQAADLANAGNPAEALRQCERALCQLGPKPEVYHLLGMIYQSSGALDKATEALGRAVYLDPHHEESLLALALIADRRGNSAQAALFRRRASRAQRSKEAR